MASTIRDSHPIIQACAETGSVALAGAPLRGAAGQSHITMLAIAGSGASVAYRKLFLSAPESERFTPGNAPAVLNVDGWRLGLAICRDTSIPQHVADATAQGIDGYVAGTLRTPCYPM